MSTDTSPNEQLQKPVTQSRASGVAEHPVEIKIESIIADAHKQGREYRALRPLCQAIIERPDMGGETEKQLIEFSRTIGLSMQQEDAALQQEARADYASARKKTRQVLRQIGRQATAWTQQFETFWRSEFTKELCPAQKTSRHVQSSRNSDATVLKR